MTPETDNQAALRIANEMPKLNKIDWRLEYARRLLEWERGRAEPVAEIAYAGIGDTRRLQFVAVKETLPDHTKLYSAPPPALAAQDMVSVPREPVAWEYQLHGSICVEYSDRPPSLVPDIENYDYRPLIYAAPAAPSQDERDAVFLPRSILVQGPVYLEIGTMKISSRSLMEAIDAAMLERKGS